MRRLPSAIAVAAGLLAPAAGTAGLGSVAPPPSGWTGQTHYSESCGGCHGLLGTSSRRDVPPLTGNVGRFLCTAEGREYLVRLPNVAFAAMDDAALARTMNFVVFGLGSGSVPADARPYTAGEIAALRGRPLKNVPLGELRAGVLGRALSGCRTG